MPMPSMTENELNQLRFLETKIIYIKSNSHFDDVSLERLVKVGLVLKCNTCCKDKFYTLSPTGERYIHSIQMDDSF